MEQFLPNIYKLGNLIVRQYLIVEGSQVYLIDTGLHGNSSKLIREMQLAKIDPEKTTFHILITHADGDHYGCVAQLRRMLPSVEVYASLLEAEAMQQGTSSRELTPIGLEKLIFKTLSPLFSSPPAKVDHILRPGDILPVAGDLQVIDSSGHTPGHLSYYLPKQGVLFAGDSIAAGKASSPAPSTGANTWDPQKAKIAFDYQMQLKPKYICAGHFYKKMI